MKNELLFSAAVTAFAWTGGANAQAAANGSALPSAEQSGPVAASKNSDADDVIDIVVTAQKREQSLQDVPIVVSVFSRQQLEASGVRDIKDLQTITPGLNVASTTSPAQTSARIRGIGTIGDNPGQESSVGTVIDGVYRARASVGLGDLGELERVEVIKGPQSTLFGKNMSAGVISVSTASPSFTPSAEFIASYGNYNEWLLSGSATTGIIDDVLAIRVFAVKRKRDGFGDVAVGAGPRTSHEDSDLNNWTVRGQLLFKPQPGFTLRLIADYAKRDENCCLTYTTVAGPTAAYIDLLATDPGIVRPSNAFNRFTYANRDSLTKIRDHGYSAQIDWDLADSVSLTSISAYRYWKGGGSNDLDFSSADIYYRPQNKFDRFKVFSQELRIAYNSELINSILGVYYSNEKLLSQASTLFGNDYERYFGLLLSGGASQTTVSTLTGRPFGANFSGGSGSFDRHFQVTEGVALFTDNTITLADGFDLNVGLRYTDETKELRSFYSNVTPGVACAAAMSRPISAAARSSICSAVADPVFNAVRLDQHRAERRFSGSAKLQYRFSRAVMVYGSYAKGFKSGGFNLDRERLAIGVIDPDTSFAAERVESFELGTKTTLFGGHVTANAAGFYQKYTGFQLNTFNGVNFIVQSIPKVTTKGVDLDFVWKTPISGLSLNSGIAYADTRFGHFVPPAGVGALLPGNTLPYAAKWNVSGGFMSAWPVISGYELTFAGSAKWTSSFNTGSNLSPLKKQDPFTLVSGRVGFRPLDKGWSVEFYVQNLTDAKYYQAVTDTPLQTGSLSAFLGAPRTYGVSGRIRF